MELNNLPYRLSIKTSPASRDLVKLVAAGLPGARQILADDGLLVYQLANATLLEIHTNETFHPQEQFCQGNTIISFPVTHLEESVSILLAAGAKMINGITWLTRSYAYCHLLLGTDLVIGLHQIDVPAVTTPDQQSCEKTSGVNP